METIKNIQAIMAFERVATHQSFSKAAKELAVSKAYLSKLVQALENELGQRLLNRSTRVVKLTHLGQVFYQTCHKSLHTIQSAKEEVLQSATRPKGKLRISLAGAFGEDYIAPFVAQFIKKYPEVNVELSFEEKIVDLVKEGFDLAIRVGHLQDSSLIAKKIATRKEYICATPTFLEENFKPESPQDLKRLNCITALDYWSFNIKGKLHSIQIKSNFKSNNGRALLKGTLSDLGITKLPGVYVKPYLKSGELVSLLEEYMDNEIPIWAITPSKKNMPVSAQVFLQEITHQFNEDY